ncbi:MAG: hypothetical protein IJP62_10005 [Treponema sp.]|nr:hypothetical protein [Treponema sp.]
MRVELRKNTRFEDFGRVECNDLSPMSGILDDISMDGCKVHYDAPVNFSFEADYELRVRFSRFPTEPLTLIAHPEWSRENGGTTEIGFSVLRSPDTARFEEYVAWLHKENLDPDAISPVSEEEKCLFV